ncbi:MAG TPA: hypothetical protein VFX98_00530 [Longimicrobiaceae bacterium]|nr:hypothetical protein [Longimicrobiaceae bacterium]
MEIRRLDGPPLPGFDCGREEQNRFFYERAWLDQRQRISTTYLYFLRGMLAAYATVCMDSLPLGRQERDADTLYKHVGALKLAQLGVDHRFHRYGFGRYVVGDIATLAREAGDPLGCRYLTLDAQPELVAWYERQGFVRNRLRQRERRKEAAVHGRDPDAIAVSMRFDLREV